MRMHLGNAVIFSLRSSFYDLTFVSAFLGYYLATLEAATQHILDIANQYEGILTTDGFYDDSDEIYDFGQIVSTKN